MTQEIPNSIIIDDAVYKQIKQYVKGTANRCEIGGVLIGHISNHTHYVEAVTGDDSSGNATETSFVLNGEVHTQLAQRIIDCADRPMEVLGVWHSHIYDAPCFSQQDRKANYTLATILGGALSLLVTWQETFQDIQLYGFYIAQDNSEHLQKLTIR